MTRLAILGGSGHGRVVADIAECCGWDEIVFFDDARPEGADSGYWAVMGDSAKLFESLNSFSGVTVAIGDNAVRAEKLNLLRRMGAPIVTLVHPSSFVSQYADLGIGTVVMPCVVVNVSANIGDGVILNTGCNIDHDCFIGSFTHVSPGASLAGGVHVGSLSWVGIGSSIKQMVRVGDGVTIGAGAVVLTDLQDGVTAVGVPAKVI